MTAKKTLILLYSVAILMLITGIVLYTSNAQDTDTETLMRAPDIGTEKAVLYPPGFRQMPALALLDSRQQLFSQDSLNGQWHWVFFGFTHCPDVCPMTLQILSRVNQQLVEQQLPQPRILLVTVDPDRDTSDKLGQYVAFFDDQALGLTGEPDQLEVLNQYFNVFATRQPADESGNYNVDHSANIFLINPDGQLHALFSTPHQVTTLVNDFTTIKAHYE